jgi:LmeA-like phospholipid-binding
MRRLTAIAVVAGAIVVLLVIAQLVLPGIAANRLKDRLKKSGDVIEVKVSAFPAIKLLWHHADSVRIRVGTYRSAPSGIGSLLAQAGDVGSIDASATQLTSGLLTVHDAMLRKRGDELTATARVDEADLVRAVPILESVQPVASGNGQLVLRGTASLFGVSATVDATVAASAGKLIVQPDVPFGGLATITVFSNPHVSVDGLSAVPAPGGFTVTAHAHVN